ncbi:MAG: thioredoxin domain-containing protein, partial [Pirellulaceae bacterium]
MIHLRPALFLFGVFFVANAAIAQEPAPQPAAKAKPKHTNRLAKETSPYLLQHAHNPVDWHPWGEEALAKAKKENKPIFLSIGYSSCHWCHVMERESFMDEEIAKFMNENFVCIKVDREERPDIDSIYMTSLYTYNRLAGSRAGGGWPLSMFLTSGGEPFFGGTYFPARDGDRGTTTGFLTIVQRVAEVWKEKPDNIKDDAAVIVKYTKAELEGVRKAVLTEINEALYLGVLPELADQFDEKHGGFGYVEEQPQKPKFPEPSNLVYLLDFARRYQDSADAERKAEATSARTMLVATLEKMSLGGIQDHLGGGFHRYSVDRYWRIPHFEKMLYDNGQLASVYAQGFELTQREDFERITRGICDFVLREMTDQAGGFYAAIDADSEHEEGKFYRWEKEEVLKLLAADEAELFSKVYGLTEEPNFEEKFYAPQLAQPLAAIAGGMKTTEAELEQRLAPIRAKLLA